MKYFAYGSNMYSCEIVTTLDIKPEIIGVIKLTGYKFAYNKESSRDHSGKANIYPYSNVYVCGVIYEVSEELMKLIDAKEGGYNKINIVLPLDGKNVKAVTYTAKPERIDDMLQPTDDYRSKIIKGAVENKLPTSYIEQFLEK